MMILLVIAVYVLNVAWVIFGSYIQSKTLMAGMLGLMTVMFAMFLYHYNISLGYAVEQELPDKFRLLSYTMHDDKFYLWVVPDGDAPKAFIIPQLSTAEKGELHKAKEAADLGVYVKGTKKKKGDSNTDEQGVDYDIVDPKNIMKKE